MHGDNNNNDDNNNTSDNNNSNTNNTTNNNVMIIRVRTISSVYSLIIFFYAIQTVDLKSS